MSSERIPPVEEPSKEQQRAWHDDPANWRWGLFYYNPLDKRILPPKRIRWMGWTINFANPRSMVLGLALIVLPALIILWLVRDL